MQNRVGPNALIHPLTRLSIHRLTRSFPIHNSPFALRAARFLLLATVCLPLLVAVSIALAKR